MARSGEGTRKAEENLSALPSGSPATYHTLVGIPAFRHTNTRDIPRIGSARAGRRHRVVRTQRVGHTSPTSRRSRSGLDEARSTPAVRRNHRHGRLAFARRKCSSRLVETGFAPRLLVEALFAGREESQYLSIRFAQEFSRATRTVVVASRASGRLAQMLERLPTRRRSQVRVCTK